MAGIDFSKIGSSLGKLAPLQFLRSKLLQQSGFYLLGQVLPKAFAFFLIPIWTAYLTPSDYGITGTLAAYSGILNIVLMLGIYGSVSRHYFEYQNDQERQREFISTNFLFMVFFSGGAIALLAIFGQPIWAAATSNVIPFQPLVVLTLITCFAGLIYRFPYTLFQAQQKAHKCVSLDLALFLASISLSLALVVGMKKGVYGMVLGACIAQVTVTAVAVAILAKEWLVPRFRWQYVLESLRFGLPLVPHLLSGWALNFVDRVMLERMVPLDEVGRYTLGYNLGMILLTIVTSINEAYQPYYFKLMSGGSPEPGRKIVRIVLIYTAGIGFLALVGSLFAGELVALLTPVKYHASARYVPPILLGYLMVGFYFFISSPLFFFKKTSLLPLVTGTAALLNIALNYLLIPRYGAIAAAWITFVCYFFMMCTYYLVARKLNAAAFPLGRVLLTTGFLLGATFLSDAAGSFTLAAWAIKSGILGAYIGLAYFLLLKPTMNSKDAGPAKNIS